MNVDRRGLFGLVAGAVTAGPKVAAEIGNHLADITKAVAPVAEKVVETATQVKDYSGGFSGYKVSPLQRVIELKKAVATLDEQKFSLRSYRDFDDERLEREDFTGVSSLKSMSSQAKKRKLAREYWQADQDHRRESYIRSIKSFFSERHKKDTKAGYIGWP
jgi:hypothetical protein